VTSSKDELRPAIVMRAQSLTCALPIEYVSETMRPVAVEAIIGAPEFVLGLAVIRGALTPVVSLPALFNSGADTTASRFIACKAGERRFALAVSEVLGVWNISRDIVSGLPPLMQHARNEIVEAIGIVDRQLLLLLNAGHVVPNDIWDVLQQRDN
jgi:purine-binding chemotaxis protein CheW